jgi:hypothetical protein
MITSRGLALQSMPIIFIFLMFLATAAFTTLSYQSAVLRFANILTSRKDSYSAALMFKCKIYKNNIYNELLSFNDLVHTEVDWQNSA